MTPDQRVLAIWGGGAGVCVVLGCVLLWSRGATLSEMTPRAVTLHGSYEKLYHPDRPQEGIPAAEAVQELTRAKERQDGELRTVEGVLVPELPKPYLAVGVNTGSAIIHSDHAAMRSRAQSLQIGLPTSLPLDRGLSESEAAQAIELSQLYLYRAVVDLCFEAGVVKISAIAPESVVPGKIECDPSGTYMILNCDFEIETGYEAGQKLLQNLLEAHKSGVGIRALTIVQGRENQQKFKLTASLITANRVGAKPAAPTERPRATVPASSAPASAPSTSPALPPAAAPADVAPKAIPPRGRLGGG
ncbi:MAG: hypothetical protein H0V44_04035 [Planctomycetes bacterium]|nr:hypothetical protein [Planctomycetota bacterium]